jgi:hypothetical protein
MAKKTPYQRMREVIAEGYEPADLIGGLADVYDHIAMQLEDIPQTPNTKKMLAFVRGARKALRSVARSYG